MEVRNDITFRPKASVPAFGAINYESAEDTLRTVLSLPELNKFKKLVADYKQYDNADLFLFGEGKKLHARIVDNIALKDGKTTEHSPWFFENTYDWIVKMANKMLNRHIEVSRNLAKQNFQF